jgi:endonuclease/exonuclease/phosphatase family metal-dependent hydrolase
MRWWVAAVVLAGCGDDAAMPDAPMPDAHFDAPAIDAASPDSSDPVLPEDPPQPLPTGAPNVKLITFNVALIDTIKGGAERMPMLIDAIKAADADVVCLEEVWNKYTTRREMANMLAPAFPYAFWTDTNTTGATGYANGVLIVSKQPLYKGRKLRFVANDPEGFVDRVIIGADVLMPDSYFHLMCTHTQAGEDDASRAARSAEVDEIVGFAQTNGYLSGPTFLLGDFNAGPDPTGSCTTCIPPDMAAYTKLLQTWTDPNQAWQQCTWCRANAVPLQVFPNLYGNGADARIDHCLYKNIGGSSLQLGALAFDQMVSIPWNSETLHNLSDHFGVRCVFSP